MRAYVIAAFFAVAIGFIVRMESKSWASWTQMQNGVPYGFTDEAKQTAFEQLSYCLMYGGTALLVLAVARRFFAKPPFLASA